ncbi:dUTP diphosphatase [uncultured Vagococcus sp.]|uniref:dUTP diphosphatase n=1 Tax=uncultured Vagococcus sp. TaxID=189676 RepID=UPI00258D0B0A|nr:dUTP diphosphatase [uncultured Vagococcus sp.]
MNFKKLQAMQLELDNSILSAKPQMTAEERFNKTLVALSVEVAEVANCAEHFKFWKDNKGKVDEKFISTLNFRFEDEVRNDKRKWKLLKDTDGLFVDTSKKYNLDNFKLLTIEQAHKLTLVEEASDCLHFILSLANQLGLEIKNFNWKTLSDSKEQSLMLINRDIFYLYKGFKDEKVNYENFRFMLIGIFSYFESLSITTQELEQAYYEKNEENYRRLREGY